MRNDEEPVTDRRVLLAVLVYNGRPFVPACLESAARVRSGSVSVDVLVLDDCSPDPGWSEELAALCDSLGIDCYRSPRNLGIPRNMNLALLRGMSAGYDHVLIVNSDVVMPANLAESMVAVAESEPRVASVTAWSNKVSVFSIPSQDSAAALSRPDLVDWISAELQQEFGSSGLTIPTAVGFCMLLPTPVVREVGLFDPLYGRGYCEEVDWSLRAGSLGYRSVLGLPVFVYHIGSASTRDAGVRMQVVGPNALPWVADHERIVDYRFPDYRRDVIQFLESGQLAAHQDRAVRTIVTAAARRWGYRIEATWFPMSSEESAVLLTVPPDGTGDAFSASFCGLRATLALPGGDIAARLEETFGRPPEQVTIWDRGRTATRLSQAAWPRPCVVDRTGYPQRV